jgi:hypothetical protein
VAKIQPVVADCPRRGLAFRSMIEAHSSEVERLLLVISDARDRARCTADQVALDGAPAHVVAALRTAERELAGVSRTLMQQTFYAVTEPIAQPAG